MGIGAMLLVALIVTNLKLAVLGFATAVIMLILTGFLVPNPRTFSFLLPAITKEELDEIAPDIRAQSYPQLFVFREEIRNLPLLLISPLYSLGLATLVIVRPDLRWAGSFEWETFPGPFIRPLGGILTRLAVLLAWSWAAERILLRRSEIRLGVIHSRMGDGEWSYEYFDLQKQRRGGTAFPWNRITHRIMPVFVDSRTGERSKPGFAFIFHRFILAETRHMPSATS
ncbi:MAG: hypothetical protein WAL71_06535 [Terriglobales bacterium]|jgi:hypothetical protein